MNTQVKSHWRLARRATWKAITVTLSVAAAYLRAKYYIVKHSERLQKKRIDYDKQMLIFIDEELDRVS
jgi:hypothetical protein